MKIWSKSWDLTAVCEWVCMQLITTGNQLNIVKPDQKEKWVRHWINETFLPSYLSMQFLIYCISVRNSLLHKKTETNTSTYTEYLKHPCRLWMNLKRLNEEVFVIATVIVLWSSIKIFRLITKHRNTKINTEIQKCLSENNFEIHCFLF